MKCYLIPFVAFLLSVGCSPKIYMVDRQTVLEDEAAGEWPQFEKEILNKSNAKGPTAFQKPEETEKKRRLFNVLNGEMISKTGSKTVSKTVAPKEK